MEHLAGVSEPVQVELEDADGLNEATTDAGSTPGFSWRRLGRFVGPGLLMCIAFVDPGKQLVAVTARLLLKAWLESTTHARCSRQATSSLTSKQVLRRAIHCYGCWC